MINNMGAIMAEMQKLQQELKHKTIEIVEGDGVFRLVINGHQQVLEVKFGPGACDPGNVEALEIMVASAINRAVMESKNIFKNEIAKLTGGAYIPDIPGLL